MDIATFNRSDSDFLSQGTRCAGWLYRPDTVENPPMVILAHGFAGERAFGLEGFAEAFAKNGYAAFVFDYRTFGDSEGSPRNNVDPLDHGQDWDAAIAHVRMLDGIDSNRIVLWGTSFSGAHVIMAAARDGKIAATISQVPFSGMPKDAPRPPLTALLKIAAYALWDSLKTALTGRPCYIPVVGPPGSAAALTTPECEAGYRALIPEGEIFHNQTPAKALIKLARYDPLAVAGKVTCPALVIAAEEDSLIPVEQARSMSSRLPRGEFHTLRCNHFAPYRGEWFDANIRLQLEFLAKRI
ncbi:MAG: alpha/beta fold hydrolase [Deltaproteobacteria bacterium]|nr:alpha/beta fold hydrolase [Deltaproteobacteria bacterium]